MKDRFKFRVWLDYEQKMITPEVASDLNFPFAFGFNQHGDLIKIYSDNSTILARIGHTIADEEIMYSTGLKDKNGKLIYEGDVVKLQVDYYNAPIQFDKSSLKFNVSSTSNYVCEYSERGYKLSNNTNSVYLYEFLKWDKDTNSELLFGETNPPIKDRYGWFSKQVYKYLGVVGNIYENKELLKEPEQCK